MPIPGVTRDPLGGWYLPSGSAEWTTLLAGSGIGNPVSVWSFQERSGAVYNDSIGSSGSNDLSVSGATAVWVPGWSRQGVGPSTSNSTNPNTNPGVSSSLLVFAFQVAALPTLVTSTLAGIGGNNSYRAIGFNGAVGVQPGHTASFMYVVNDGSAQNTGSFPVTTGQVYLAALWFNHTAGSTGIVTENEVITQIPYTVPPSTAAALLFGSALANVANCKLLYGALWQGANAELSPTQVQGSLFNLMKYGSTARGVTQDTTSGWYAPRDPTEWAQLLTGSGVPVPASAYNLTENGTPSAGGPGQDMFRNDHLVSGTLGGFGGAFPGWSRVGYVTNDGGAYNAVSANNLSGVSRALLMYYGVSGSASPQNMLAYMGNLAAVGVVSSSLYEAGNNISATGQRGTVPLANPGVRPFLYVVNNTLSSNKLYTTQESFTGSPGGSDSNPLYLGSPFGSQAPAPSGTMLYASVWTGSLAEMTDTQAANLLRLLQFGTLAPNSSGTLRLQGLVYGTQHGVVEGAVEGQGTFLNWKGH